MGQAEDTHRKCLFLKRKLLDFRLETNGLNMYPINQCTFYVYCFRFRSVNPVAVVAVAQCVPYVFWTSPCSINAYIVVKGKHFATSLRITVSYQYHRYTAVMCFAIYCI